MDSTQSVTPNSALDRGPDSPSEPATRIDGEGGHDDASEQTPEKALHRALGLTDGEFSSIGQILGREPNHLELAMYSVMWSEHCSYKSSRLHLRRLPTEGEAVLVGPGENAGVVDVGEGLAVALRIESHNHPSAIEPYQGAATGVGGILRDIFTMGARPIALLDPLRFGPLDDPRSRWIAEGVVSGVSGYGNAVGVPTIGGETVFDQTYAENPLVNVMCVGILPVDRLVLGQATGIGNLAVLLGSRTGRDGIGGVSVLASAGFDAGDEEKRPSVQVGDPYEEKRLIEGCLALLDAGLVVGIQDLGGAGLTCATSETASRGGVGMDVDVRAVPQREPGMTPVEIMTSESQERMLAIVTPEALDRVLSICDEWEVAATVIGRVTDGGRLRILDGSTVVADVPAASLHEDAPLYDRERREPPHRPGPDPDPDEANWPAESTPGERLLSMCMDTSWVWTQYDHQLFCNTVAGPGTGAAVLRLRDPVDGVDTGRGLAVTTDGNHRWCAVDPRSGTAALVAESLMNLAVVGAEPIALVNCLNFGNPEHPEVMWQLSESIDGMAQACTHLGIPVVGGNVSLYNESRGRDIDPTPVVGLLGVIPKLDRSPPVGPPQEGDRLLLIGTAAPGLAGSLWAWENDHRTGRLPEVDFDSLADTAAVVRSLVAGGVVRFIDDIAEGGLGLTLAELVARSGTGVRVARVPDVVGLFSECPGRALAAVDPEVLVTVEEVCAQAGVATSRIGVCGGDRFSVKGLVDLPVSAFREAWSDRLPRAVGGGTCRE